MLISVVYQDDKHDSVKPFLLDALIASGQVKKFLRSDGWATVGISPMRGNDRTYKSYNVERRNFLAGMGPCEGSTS